jgi:hypothetical protein
LELRDLCEIFNTLPFPRIEEHEHPERKTILAARSYVAEAVADSVFLSDCIFDELERLQRVDLGEELDPFFTISDLGIRFSLGYWPPGSTAKPHEHTAWTITAVCWNQLEVITYDREAVYRRGALIPKNWFNGEMGRTGFIYEPCVHEPRNTSRDWSLSLHITSPRDGERPADYIDAPQCLWTRPRLSSLEVKHPYTSAVARRRQQTFVHQLVRILCSMEAATAKRALTRARGLCCSATKAVIDQAVPELNEDSNFESPWILKRVHENLVLVDCNHDGSVSLNVETSSGFREELNMSDIARDAIALIAREQLFDVRQLPGNLSQVERAQIGTAIEATGLFRRVWQ